MDGGMLRRQARLVPMMGRPDVCKEGSHVSMACVLAAGLRRCAGGARAQRFVGIRQTASGPADGVQTPVLRVGRHGGSIDS